MLKKLFSLLSTDDTQFNSTQKPRFYSQYEQDKFLYENFFNKKDGVFLEVGADDGVDKSNTLFFEESLNWTGLCVEPSPERFKLLRANRTCYCEEVAIAQEHGSVEFMDIRGWGKGLSGIRSNYDQRHVERIEKELGHSGNKGHSFIEVKTVPLNELLTKHKLTHINFCTIDTEGSEAEVIKSINFDTCRFDLILVENNYEETTVHQLLIERGFELLTRVGIDDVFVNRDFDTSHYKKEVANTKS